MGRAAVRASAKKRSRLRLDRYPEWILPLCDATKCYGYARFQKIEHGIERADWILIGAGIELRCIAAATRHDRASQEANGRQDRRFLSRPEATRVIMSCNFYANRLNARFFDAFYPRFRVAHIPCFRRERINEKNRRANQTGQVADETRSLQPSASKLKSVLASN